MASQSEIGNRKSGSDLQSLCEAGQRHLVATDYLAAEAALVEAERIAWDARDWDTLSRLYMPLQEARRQRRQRSGEGVVKLDLVAKSQSDALDPEVIAKQYPHGQLLVAGCASIEPAKRLRAIAREKRLYVETYLAASYRAGDAIVVAIVPTDDVALPPDDGRSIDRLVASLPPHSVVMPLADLPSGSTAGTDATYARTMALWEQLHAPFLALAESTRDPVERMKAYRRTIEVDYACEIAHQHLSATAGVLRGKR
jgi:hypothetical protein